MQVNSYLTREEKDRLQNVKIGIGGAGGLGGVAGGGVLLVQRVNVDSGLSHDMSFACRGVPSAGALTGRPG